MIISLCGGEVGAVGNGEWKRGGAAIHDAHIFTPSPNLNLTPYFPFVCRMKPKNSIIVVISPTVNVT